MDLADRLVSDTNHYNCMWGLTMEIYMVKKHLGLIFCRVVEFPLCTFSVSWY